MTVFLLCLKVFFTRIIDVSLGTFRTITIVKGKTLMASIIGFFEVLIWFLIVKEALNTEINSIWIGISYALGFACGTLVGGFISGIFINGNLSVQVITSKVSPDMIKVIRDNGYAVSIVNLVTDSEKNKKNMLFMEINKKELKNLEKLIKQLDEKAFIVVNESKYVANGYFKDQIIK